MSEIPNYPNNSKEPKEVEAKRAEKKVEKVVSGEVVRRKPTLGSRFRETFGGEDARSVGSHILFDVIIPDIGRMLSDAVSQGAERLFVGSTSGRRETGPSKARHTSYNKMYSGSGSGRGSRNISHRGRASHDFSEIVVESRGEAEKVIDRLYDLVSEYDVASVADFYDLVDITGSFADDKWGWTDLRGSQIRRDRDGFRIILPKPIELD